MNGVIMFLYLYAGICFLFIVILGAKSWSYYTIDKEAISKTARKLRSQYLLTTMAFLCSLLTVLFLIEQLKY